MRSNISSGSPLEPEIGFFPRCPDEGRSYSSLGPPPLPKAGAVAARGDVYSQTKRCIEIAANAITEAGFSLATMVRTRVMLVDISRWREAARAHGETFSSVKPACTFVEVKGFIDRDWLVEIEIDCLAWPET